MHTGSDTDLQRLIDGANAGDATAREALIAYACERLHFLTRKKFHRFPALQRFLQTDDVHQGMLVRLNRALADVKVHSARHFLNLAAEQIRRELLDLKKKWFGPHGQGLHHHSDGKPADDEGGIIYGRAEESDDLEAWSELHEEVEKLPDEERVVFNLLVFLGMTQMKAAEVLGVSLSTVKRRWLSILSKLEALKPDGNE